MPEENPTKKEKPEQAAATTAPSKPKVAKQDTTQKERAAATTAPSKPKVAKQTQHNPLRKQHH